MGFDDDDLDEPLSGRKALERSDHGTQEKAEQKQQEQRKELSKLKLQMLRQKLAPQDTEEKREEGGEDEGVKTRTREEEVKQSTDTARTKPGPEALIKKEEQEKRTEQQARYEQGKDQTA